VVGLAIAYFLLPQPHKAENQTACPLTTTEHFVDLNYLYQRHQVALFMAEHGSSDRVREIHGEFADRYAARIAEARQSRVRLRAI
jgi:hypothetical protein